MCLHMSQVICVQTLSFLNDEIKLIKENDSYGV